MINAIELAGGLDPRRQEVFGHAALTAESSPRHPAAPTAAPYLAVTALPKHQLRDYRKPQARQSRQMPPCCSPL